MPNAAVNFRRACLAASLLGLPLAGVPGTAAAQVTGLYIGAAAGPLFQRNVTNNREPTGRYTEPQPNQPADQNIIGRGVQANFTTGVVGLGNIGYGFGNGLRAELEANYRGPGLEGFRLYQAGSYSNGWTSRTGDFRTYGLIANAYYDFDTNFFPENWRFFQPYVGVGVGYGWAQLRNIRASYSQNGQASNLVSLAEGTSGNLAYQFIVGAAFPIDSVLDGLAVTAEARYYGMLDARYRADVNAVNSTTQGNTVTTSYYRLSSGKLNLDVRSTSLLLGLRLALDQPARAGGVAANLPAGWTAPALPPVQARTYTVFFANNSAVLDASARRTVAEAVQSIRTIPTTSLELAGRADGTGQVARNQRLSEQRVANVAAELVRMGVPADRIARVALGAAGEAGANAQSRRVDIVLR